MASLTSLLNSQSPAFWLGIVTLFAAALYSRRPKSKFPLPPGPKGSPIIGNIRQVPTERSDLQFAKWAQEYSSFLPIPRSSSSNTNITESDIIYVSLLGQPVIILNSVKTATDLLEKRGAIYSDRPSFALLEAYDSLIPILCLPC
jgi:hypothetical protein